MMTTDQTIRPSTAVLATLDDAPSEDPARSGNKAATLARLRRGGFEVPPGVVVFADILKGADDDLPDHADVPSTLQGRVRNAMIRVRPCLGEGVAPAVPRRQEARVEGARVARDRVRH